MVAHELSRRKKIFIPSQLTLIELLRDSLGYEPDLIVDIGAGSGEWSRIARSIYPYCNIFMVEPLADCHSALESLSKSIRATFSTALLSAQNDIEVDFCEMNNGSSVYPEKSHILDRIYKVYRTRTLDSLLSENSIIGTSLLVRMDVQGFELEVLKGCTEILKNVSAISIELSFVSINEGAPNSAEVIAFLHDKDFLLADISQFSRRKDNFLWAADFLFLSKNIHSLIFPELTPENWWC